MKINLGKIFILGLPAWFLFMPANAFGNDFDYAGDFSSRSLIMKSLSGENRISQEMVDILKSKNLTPSTACLIEQIKKNNIVNAKILLDSKVNPNAQYNTFYPIYVAAKDDNLEMVKLLYSYGAKLDKGFYSELYEAIKNKNKEMIRFLLDNGAKVNYKDAVSGKTPLYLALKNNMIDIAQELIDKGANIDKRTYLLIKKKKLDSMLQKIN